MKLSLHFFAPHLSHLLDYDDDHDDDDHAVDEYDVYRHRSEVDEFPSYSI